VRRHIKLRGKYNTETSRVDVVVAECTHFRNDTEESWYRDLPNRGPYGCATFGKLRIISDGSRKGFSKGYDNVLDLKGVVRPDNTFWVPPRPSDLEKWNVSMSLEEWELAKQLIGDYNAYFDNLYAATSDCRK
jgi:hypothetical protein